MPVVQAALRERHGVGAILGGTEHAGLLAAAGDAITFQVGDMGGQRRRAEGAAPMLDHPRLDDDAALGGEESAAAEHGPAAPERRSAVPRGPPAPGGRTFMTGFPHGAQHLVDEALAAASIADASQQDLELVIVVVHGHPPGRFEWPVPKRGLKDRAFCLRVAPLPDRRRAGS